jgi:hypothetical protein
MSNKLFWLVFLGGTAAAAYQTNPTPIEFQKHLEKEMKRFSCFISCKAQVQFG